MNELVLVLETHRDEFRQIINKTNNYYGSDYEINQVLKTIKGFGQHEWPYLQKSKELKRVVTFGARNVPLYTLIQHVLIPATKSQEVVLRTPTYTREVYNELYGKIKSLMPQYDLSRIQLQDQNYDEFINRYILGFNGSGKSRVGTPADVILFTGDPQTAKSIQEKVQHRWRNALEREASEIRQKEEQIIKLQAQIDEYQSGRGQNQNEKELTKLSNRLQKTQESLEELRNKLSSKVDLRQIFLKFGVGLNPLVVTNLAKNYIERAEEATLRSIRINSAQDCSAPKFLAINSNFFNEFVTGLLSKIKQLKYGSLDDPKADYSSLTYTQKDKLPGLMEFREKHKEFLANPEAVIDVDTMRVDPHVFVFPYEKFKEVELKDHFAPFIIVFEYSTERDLKKMLSEKRVQDKGMYATLFGDPKSIDMARLRKYFEDNYMSTVVNLDVFDEEAGYMPFGGRGKDSSELALINEDKVVEFHRPLLFSKEVATFFKDETNSSSSASEVAGNGQELAEEYEAEKSRNKLRELLSKYLDPMTKGMIPRKTGLEFIRETIAKKGMAIVINNNFLGAGKHEEMKFFYGADLFYLNQPKINESKKALGQMPTVLLHMTSVNNNHEAHQILSSDINLTAGPGDLHLGLHDKVDEYHFANAIWPGIMAKSKTMDELPWSEEFQGQLASFKQKIQDYFEQRRLPNGEEKIQNQKELGRLLTEFFNGVNSEFPKGAFIKNYDEFTTGDLGNQITSHHYNLENMIKQFEMCLEDSLRNLPQSARRPGHRQQVRTNYSLNNLSPQAYDTSCKFIKQLMTGPEKILMQERLKLAKTEMGAVKEVRVDFVESESTNARPRYTNEYMRPQEEAAKKLLNDFFQKAKEYNPFLGQMSGGADVAQLEDGSYRIIEFNFGGSSGSMDPLIYPIYANEFVSNIMGRPTPFLSELQNVKKQSLEQQRAYLQSFKREEEAWYKYGYKDISKAEVARWLRDQYLDDFFRRPTREKGDEVLSHLEQLFHQIGDPVNRDFDLLLKGARDSINERLTE